MSVHYYRAPSLKDPGGNLIGTTTEDYTESCGCLECVAYYKGIAAMVTAYAPYVKELCQLREQNNQWPLNKWERRLSQENPHKSSMQPPKPNV